jgi:hypothetical protein
VLVGTSARTTAAQPNPTFSSLYKLSPNAAFITGCFPPCACPVLITSKVQGTFLLRQVGFDPLFTTYEVSDVRWTLPDVSPPVQVRGAGTYRVGGEFAVQQQLVLDLTFDSGAPLHFDSGVVAGGGVFPDIDIRTSLRQEHACTDSVFDVKASPVSATSAEGGAASRAFQVSVMNPFYGATSVRLTLAQPARVDIEVFDAQGRLVRRLAHARSVSAGESAVAWDGLNDRGQPVAAGIYSIRVRTAERQVVRRAVKLD